MCFVAYALRSQIVPLGLFVVFQALAYFEAQLAKRKLSNEEAQEFRKQTIKRAFLAMLAAIVLLGPTGAFGPVSLRVRSLFVPHTRTGNPLVDSVAEHQATSPDAYYRYLHNLCFLGPVGLVIMLVKGRGDAKSFAVLYALIAYYFASKMNRLIILMGPVASVMGGVALGVGFDWCLTTLVAAALEGVSPKATATADSAAATADGKKGAKEAKKQKRGGGSGGSGGYREMLHDMVLAPVVRVVPPEHRGLLRAAIAVVIIAVLPGTISSFYAWSHDFAYRNSLGAPTVIFQANTPQGPLMITDYLDRWVGYGEAACMTQGTQLEAGVWPVHTEGWCVANTDGCLACVRLDGTSAGQGCGDGPIS